MNFVTFSYDELTSTNDEAASQARAGAAEGMTVTARRQTAGRGRHQRNWASEAGNLFASIILRPTVPPRRLGEISFVVALATAETLRRFGAHCRLKWPNDVLVDGAKIAGILLESEPGWVVAGIGINLAHSPEIPDRPATSLMALGKSIEPLQALAVLQTVLGNWYERWLREGFAPIRAAWLAEADGQGGLVTVRLADNRNIQGVFETLDADGALLLRTPEGELRRILAGDVFFS